MVYYPSLEEIPNVAGKRVLLRLDLNVVVKNGHILDDFRIVKSLPTISYLRSKEAKLILVSHIGEDPKETLKPVADYLNIKLLPSDPNDPLVRQGIEDLKNGGVVLLENVRQNPGEVLNEEGFARSLSSLADIYVDDAFAVMHRKHASLVSVPKFLPSYMGLLTALEVKNLSRSFNPEHPFLFIVGGAKFETKMTLVKKFIDIADKVFIGGALSNTVFKSMGFETGKSLIDSSPLDLDFLKGNPKIILPTDVKVLGDAGEAVKKFDGLMPTDNMLDIGPETLTVLKKEIVRAKFILWNGPMGNYEKGFAGMTEDLARLISESGAVSIVGGGDTIASIKSLGLLDKFTFVSTGGGAMLDFLANGTLLGLEALSRPLS